MAIALANTGTVAFANNVASSNPYSPTLAYTPTVAGNVLVISGSAFAGTSGANPVVSVSDSVDGAWPVCNNAAHAPSSTTHASFIAAIKCSSTAARTITLTITDASGTNWYYTAVVTEWSGLATSGNSPVVDQHSETAASATGPTLTLTSITTANANDLILANASIFMGSGTGAPTAPTSPWTVAANRAGGTSGQSHQIAYQIVSATGTFGPTMTFSGTAPGWSSGCMLALQAQAAVSGRTALVGSVVNVGALLVKS